MKFQLMRSPDACENYCTRFRGEIPESMATPDDFICPITWEVMRDPVVASDGHSYERAAIEEVLSTGNGLSPLTREVLRRDFLVPNRNLRRRIESHEGEVLGLASQAADYAAERAVAADSGGAQAASKRV